MASRPGAFISAIVVGVALGAGTGGAAAQAYPAKPVRIIVSSSAGGSPDIQIRLVTQKMAEANGYTWIIENLPGAGGNLAPERAAKAAPDGYTLLASAGTTSAEFAVNLKAEIARIAPVVRASGAKVE
jgi:tripartite-type tricarboxylate transporter receptor subunit TctC